MTQRLIIAIDGPSGAGKGTIARAVASRLGYRHIDTGAMYRAVAWKALHDGVDPANEAAVAAIGKEADFVLDDGRVVIDGHDVARAIRTPEIDRVATIVARHPAVRRALVARQREYANDGIGIVMEGRDIGTVVFPNADVKIYLDASPEERARRRAADPAHTSKGTQLSEVATALAERDRSDATRAVSPLAIATDAVLIDTTELPVDTVVETVMNVLRERLKAEG